MAPGVNRALDSVSEDGEGGIAQGMCRKGWLVLILCGRGIVESDLAESDKEGR